jgi:L-fuculose-phosphate aldolase
MTDAAEPLLRQAVVQAAQRLNPLGINQGTSGNVSARAEGGFLITPSGVPYEDLAADRIAFVNMQGAPSGPFAPSTEWRFHRDIYARRPEAGGVVHTHSPYATSLACLGKSIPAFHYMVAVAGGADIRCADYATFGTQDLSEAALGALENRKACLLANHGMIALGETVETALALAVEVEALAAQYWRALQIGKPTILSKAEMKRVLKKFESYGKPSRTPE